MLNPYERRAVARIENDQLYKQVEQWCAINSGTRNLDGLNRMAGMLADAFSVLPGNLELIEGDRHRAVDEKGRIEELHHGRHLHVSVRPEAPVRMLFTGHMDTVYPVDHPFQATQDRGDGTLNGPGTADMKGGLAVMLAALQAVEASGAAGSFGFEVVINADEETGSFSSAALLARAARGKVAALTYEPALADGTLAGARGGTGNFSIIVRGCSAHAGRNPAEGRNAIVAAADLTMRLSNIDIPGLTVNPARIDGGGPNNVVPDLAVLRINFRPGSLNAIERAREYFASSIQDVAADRDVEVEVHGSFNRPPKPIDEGAAKLFSLVRDVGAECGLAIEWRATGGVCDGNNIAAAGVPVIDTMGVRGGAIHSSDEFMIIDSLAERAALSAVTIMRIIEKGGL